MKIVITGASGFVGQLLVPRLQKLGIELLLVGRDTAKLGNLYPAIQNCDYNQLAIAGVGADCLVNLAVANSNSKLSEQDIHFVNVDLLVSVAKQARDLKIPRFINTSSVHALYLNNNTAYADSKRLGAMSLESLEGYKTETVYLATVYGERWSGKLAILNHLPNFLASSLFAPLAALKPVLHIDQFIAYILETAPKTTSRSPIILAEDKSRSQLYVMTTRLVDLTFALSVLVFMGWAMVLIWLLIKSDSDGPGIFVQTRIGKDQKAFFCYKFRTMMQGTKQLGTHEVSAASITSIGAILRKTKIDELPQIINIFRNELSLIGPRPCLAIQTELIAAREAYGVFAVKPGITGLAQINDIDMSNPELLAKWDAQYIALRGLSTDCSIAIATATGRGQGDKINH